MTVPLLMNMWLCLQLPRSTPSAQGGSAVVYLVILGGCRLLGWPARLTYLYRFYLRHWPTPPRPGGTALPVWWARDYPRPRPRNSTLPSPEVPLMTACRSIIPTFLPCGLEVPRGGSPPPAMPPLTPRQPRLGPLPLVRPPGNLGLRFAVSRSWTVGRPAANATHRSRAACPPSAPVVRRPHRWTLRLS